MDKKITWLQTMSEDKLDSVWYGGDMVKIEISHYDIYITASGDIRATIKGKNYCDKGNGGRFVEYLNENGIYNDKELKEAIENGEITFVDNNWFEMVIWDNEEKDYVEDFDSVVDLEPNDNFSWVEDLLKEYE